MIYYCDSNDELDISKMEKYGCTEMSPALRYAGTHSFEDILNDINRGDIPTNSGEPFPVIWKNDNNMNLLNEESSVPNFAGSNTGFINPAPGLINI